ncbi:MAG: AIPR family protein [Patescibacteria group bacterium]|nr:AIPR family protein [Patescibacteria group bacterium]
MDHKAKAVFLVQGKYRQTLSGKAEKRGDVMGFANLAKPFADCEPGPFEVLVKDMHPHAAKLLCEARPFVARQGYRLWMYYVTLGSVSSTLAEEAEAAVADAAYDAIMEVLDGHRLMHLLRDYLDGVAPPIPTLDLEMEHHAGVKVNGVLQRFDSNNNIESWVFSMRGDKVADMFDFAGIRLYARNIRGFLGEKTAINEGMTETLAEEPDHFFYYNNGITIICDRAEKRSHSGVDFLRVSNPQVINGQQTSRMLAIHKKEAEAASVLVKVMQVPREPGAGKGDEFDTLVSRIVANTNWQNAINYADLVSNDRIQIEIERAFRKVGYIYLRKRQKKSEARKLGGKRFFIIKKEELAQAIAACEMDPVTVREGKNELFGTHYQAVFPSTDAGFYLPRHWARQQIRLATRGKPQWSYANWSALHFLWSRLKPLLNKEEVARRFRTMCERKDAALVVPLGQAINVVFLELLAYYRANRGTGASVLDHSTFFRNKRGRHLEFERFWKSSATRQRRFDIAWGKVTNALLAGKH